MILFWFLGMFLIFVLGKSRINYNVKRVIIGAILFLFYVMSEDNLKGVIGLRNHTLDVIITNIIFGPFAIWMLGWIVLAVLGEDTNSKN